MEFVKRKMCRECPWRTESAPGYLGSAAPEDFVNAIQNNEKMPCHLTINYDDPNWHDKMANSKKSQYCIGALKATKTLCKRPYDKDHCNAIDEVAKSNKEEILSPWGEFQDHHNGASVRSWELGKKKERIIIDDKNAFEECPDCLEYLIDCEC